MSSINDRMEEFSTFQKAMKANSGDQSELAHVLIVASYLDGQLRKILEAFFAPNTRARTLLEGPTAPIGSFSSRISLCYSLALITEQEYLSIQAIRRIRNLFAHELSASFRDERLTANFNALAWASLTDKAGDRDRGELLFIASLRVGFGLANRADHVASERRHLKEWPNHRIDAIVDDGYDMIN